MTTATAQSHPNIAFIKYWGNRDNTLRLPMNGSISMNLDGLYTRTTVSFQPSLPFDELIINGHEMAGAGLERVSYILDIVRGMANIHERAEIISENNFPSGAGIASSASAFAALALAGSKAAGLNLSEQELSLWRGSGSAARSITGAEADFCILSYCVINSIPSLPRGLFFEIGGSKHDIRCNSTPSCARHPRFEVTAFSRGR